MIKTLLLALFISTAQAQHHPSSITSEHPWFAPEYAWSKGAVVSRYQCLTIAHGNPIVGQIIVTRQGTRHRVTELEHIKVPGITDENLNGDLYLARVDVPFKVLPLRLAHGDSDKRVMYGGHQLGQWSKHRRLALLETKVFDHWPDYDHPAWIIFSLDPFEPTIPGDSGSVIVTAKNELVSLWTRGSNEVTGGQGIDLTHPWVQMLLANRIDKE